MGQNLSGIIGSWETWIFKIGNIMYILYSGEWSSSEGETEDAREGQGAGGSQPDSTGGGTFRHFSNIPADLLNRANKVVLQVRKLPVRFCKV